MIGLLEMLVTAALVSGAGVLCLKLLPHAPPRIRFRVALAALAAWAVPWPLLSIPLELPETSPIAEWRETLNAALPWHLGAADDVSLPAGSAPALPPSIGSRSGSWSRAFDDTGTSLAQQAQAQPKGAAAAAVRGLQGAPVGYLVALLFLPGVLRLVNDAVALRASLATWRKSSLSGEAFRGVLPPELRNVRASIRIVPGSAIAATSGWLRPVVWLGDRLCDRDREVALVHELCHVQRKDPLWITFVTAVRRAYWWNPAVAWLCREAVLAMEADCDRRCARWFGVEPYTERLASMMLDAVKPPAPRLVAAARTPNLNVRRLKLLQAPHRWMRRRDYVLMALTASLGAVSAAYAVAKPIKATDAVRTPMASVGAAGASSDRNRLPMERMPADEALIALGRRPSEQVPSDPARPEWSRVPIPDTPAGEALQALLSAFNAGDSERLAAQLGAFTPQELEFDVPRSSQGLELIALVASEPLRIEYVAEDRVDGTRRRGALEIDARDTTRISRLEITEVEARGEVEQGEVARSEASRGEVARSEARGGAR